MGEFLDWLKVLFGCMVGLLIMFAFEHTPLGDAAKLKAAQNDASVYLGQKNAVLSDLGQCKANGVAASNALKTAQADATSALNMAQAQCSASAKASFNAGVIAGRVLEKRNAANASTSSSASVSSSPSADDGVSDFADLWNSAASAN